MNKTTKQITTTCLNGQKVTYVKETSTSNGVTYSVEKTTNEISDISQPFQILSNEQISINSPRGITNSTNNNNSSSINQTNSSSPFRLNQGFLLRGLQRERERNNTTTTNVNNSNNSINNSQQNASESNVNSNNVNQTQANNNPNVTIINNFFLIPYIPAQSNNNGNSSQNAPNENNSNGTNNNLPQNLIFIQPLNLLIFPENLPKTDYSKNLDKLPIRKIEEDLCSNSCVICLNDFKKDDTVYDTPCKHTYHKDCLDKWFKENNTCPTCRTKVE